MISKPPYVGCYDKGIDDGRAAGYGAFSSVSIRKRISAAIM
jgi:hypothetical protein